MTLKQVVIFKQYLSVSLNLVVTCKLMDTTQLHTTNKELRNKNTEDIESKIVKVTCNIKLITCQINLPCL